MGDRSSPSVHYPPWDDSACHWVGVKGGREVYPMRLPLQPTKAWPRGGPTHHETCGIPDFQQRDQGPLSQHLPVEKVTWSTALWATSEERSNLGHPVLSKGTVCIDGSTPLQLKKTHEGLSLGLGLGPGGGKTHIRKPSERTGQLTRWC